MIREYALDKIEENKKAKKVFAGWANEETGTSRYIAMWLCRSLSLRSSGDLLILNNIFTAYELKFDFSEQAEQAERYFMKNNTNNVDLNYITLKTAKLLAKKVEKLGLDPLLDAITHKR